MISERGRVLAVESDAIWVETLRRSTCQSCTLKKGCGHGLMGEAIGGRREQVRVLLGPFRSEDLCVGDDVDIDIPESLLVGSALLVYLLPLVTLLLGAVCGQQWSPTATSGSDASAVMGALGGFVLGLVAVRLHSHLNRHRAGYQPVLAAVRKQQPAIVPTSL